MRSVAIWAMPEQAELMSRIAEGAGLEVACAGSPARGQAGALAAAMKVSSLDDLRSALAERVADVVLIGSPGDFGADPDRPDAELVRAAMSRGTRVLTLEPLPPSALLLARGGWMEPAHAPSLNGVTWCPTAGHSYGWRQMPDLRESFGAVRAMSVESFGSLADGTLGARLIAAVEIVLWMMGVPDAVDAAYVGPDGGTVHALPGETLRDLRGTVTANLRFADGRAATLAASDGAGVWRRAATLIGPGGSVRISDDGLEWHSPDGTLQDKSRPKVERPWGLASHEVIAEAVTRTLDASIPDPGAAESIAVLLVAQAALLSARTGQSEAVETIRNMAGVERK